MRSLDSVIDHMLPHIPDGQPLATVLKIVKVNLPYFPPEAVPNLWYMAQKGIEKCIGYPPKEDWHFKVLAIWMDKPIEEIKML